MSATDERQRKMQGTRPAQLLTIFLASFATLCFALFIIGELGIALSIGSWSMLLFVVGTYLVVGLFSRTMSNRSWFAANHRLFPGYNGMGIAMGFMSVAIVASMVSGFYDEGPAAFSWIVGLLLAAIISNLSIAPFIRGSGAYTLAEAVSAKFRNDFTVRLLMVIATLVIGGLLLMVQLVYLQLIGAFSFGLPPATMLIIVMAAVTLCLLSGGLKALSWVRAAMFAMALIGITAPLVWISWALSGNPVPQLGFGGGALSPMMLIETELVNEGLARSETVFSPFLDGGVFSDPQAWLLVICLGFGVATFPHLVQHHVGDRSVAASRVTSLKTLLFVAIFLSIIPAFAVFLRFEILNAVAGLPVGELAMEAPWLFQSYPLPIHEFVSVCGQAATSSDAVIAACGGSPDRLLGPSDMVVSPQLLMSGLPEFAGLGSVFSVLVAGAILALCIATIDGVVLSIATTLGHDIYFHRFRPSAPSSIRLFTSRFALVLTVVVFCWLAHVDNIASGAELGQTVQNLLGLALALSAGIMFPIVMLTIWWRPLSNKGVTVGMLTGMLAAAVHSIQIILGNDLVSGTGDELPAFAAVSPTFSPLIEVSVSSFAATFLVAIAGSYIWRVSPEAEARLQNLRFPDKSPLVKNDLI